MNARAAMEYALPIQRNIWKSRKTEKPARKALCCWRRDSRLRSLPRRPKSEAEEKRHRRLIGIRPIVMRPVVVIRPIVRAVRMVPDMPGATPRAEVGRLQRLTCMDAGFRVGRGGTRWRDRPNQRQSRGEDGACNPSLHAIQVFMQSMSSCEPCLHASAPRTISSVHASAPPDGLISHARQARGLRAYLNSLAHRPLVLPAVPVAMMMAMITPMAVVAPMVVAPVMVVMAPMHLGGDVLGVILHRGGATGTGQRQCLGALGWSSQDQQRANGSKPQKSCHLHICILLWVMCVTPAPHG